MEINRKLTEDLIKTTNEVRQKCNSLKRSKYDEEIFLEESFKPITKPLKNFLMQQQQQQQVPSTSTPYSPPFYSKQKKTEKSESESENEEETSDNDDDDDNEDQHNNDNSNYDDERILKYMSMLDRKDVSIDKSYGVYILFMNRLKIYKIGNAEIILTDTRKISINNKEYIPTAGLCDLLFLKEPKNYSQDDLKNYSEILLSSDACYRKFDRNQQIKGTNTYKYRTIIKPIVDQNKKKSGKGFGLMNLPKENIDFIYWDDPNEIVDRLRLLMASTQAGHNSHNNEIMSIIEELREANIII